MLGRKKREDEACCPGKACERVSTFLQVLHLLGHELRLDSSILDFGCGNGEMVKGLLDAGFSARGCDIAFPVSTSTDALRESRRLATIEGEPYRLPYPDECFDAVISDQVFEHIIDYDAAIDEIHRVLKPCGVTLHIFPSRLALVEVHTHVPAAGFFRPYWWLTLWAHLGTRMAHLSDKSAAEEAHTTYVWLRQRVNYRGRNWIRTAFGRRFRRVAFCEREFLRQSRRSRLVSLASAVPMLPAAYGTFRSTVLFAEKQ